MLDSTYEKHKHLINTRINKWTILDIVEHRNKDKGYIYTKCRCICGTVRDVRLSVLLNNKCIDCGCGQKERQKEKTRKKYEHLIDTTINGWSILDIILPDGNHHSTYVVGECKCGTIKEVSLSYITSGRSKDCGCGRKETMSKMFTKDLIGQRFGKLVVVEMLEQRNKYGRILYKCKCDCGNIVDVLGNSLVLHHTASCGCLNSYWNLYIKQFLEINNIEHKAEYTVYVNNNYYRFDFYLPQYNLFIEYDGQQHYEPVRFHGCNEEENQCELKKIQEHDKIKNNYCKENNINLLRIPYWETKNIETIINNHLQRLSEKDFIEKSMKYATV